MEIESFRESCGACGSRSIRFVIDPPFLNRHCSGCGRDNSITWGNALLPEYWRPMFPERRENKPLKIPVGTPVPLVKPWDRLSNFERSQHFTDAALHE